MDYYNRLNASALDPDFPTVFELLSAEELKNLIRPSFRYLLVHYAQRNPAYLLRLANKFDELYLVIFGVIEYYYLKSWNSSFTERFYGLKRTRTLNFNAVGTRQAVPDAIEAQRRLTRVQIAYSMFNLVGYPYIKEKLDARYEVLKGRYAFRDFEPPSNWRESLQQHADKAVLRWYPRLIFAENITSVLFLIGYLFHKTQYSSISQLVGRYKYSRISNYDHELNAPGPGGIVKNAGRLALSGFNYALPTALFVLKFLEWWNSSEFSKKINKTAPLFPPPPSRVLGLKSCPICGGPPENPSALETGVVCCYKCIYAHIQTGNKNQKPKCPATSKPLLLTTWNSELNEWMPGGVRRLMI